MVVVKRWRLKQKYRDMLKGSLVTLVLLLGVLFCMWVLAMLNNSEKKNAIERCGGEDNIVERYTKEGDIYYQCKVEK